MRSDEILLEVRLEGSAIGPGRIKVEHLVGLLTGITKAFLRCGQVLAGNVRSLRRGPKPRSLKDEIALELVKLSHGSIATVLGFERRRPQMELFEDFGLQIIEKTILGLGEVQKPGDAFPHGYDLGVLRAWRDVGSLFEKGVSKMEFTLNRRPRRVTIAYTPLGYEELQKRIQGPQTNVRTIEGRLLMVDFKEHGMRLRIHPSVGEPIFCLFDENLKEEVLENILHYVRITGEAKEDPVTGKIKSITIHDIQRLEEREQEDLLPPSTPPSIEFWQSPSLEELAQTQHVGPIQDIWKIWGTWPGEIDDGFEEEIERIRQAHLAGGND